MNSKDKIVYISNWIKDYAKYINNNPTTLEIGVSGGVDSAESTPPDTPISSVVGLLFIYFA